MEKTKSRTIKDHFAIEALYILLRVNTTIGYMITGNFSPSKNQAPCQALSRSSVATKENASHSTALQRLAA